MLCQYPPELIPARQLANRSPVPTIVADAEGDVVYANAVAWSITGSNHDAGHPADFITECFRAADGKTARKLIRDVLDKGGPAGTRLRIGTATDPFGVLDLIAIPIRGAAGRPKGVLMMLVA